MSWVVRWEKEASEQLVRLATHEPNRAKNIKRRVSEFAVTSQGDIKKLKGREDQWRLRIGSWRVIFTYDRRAHTLIVLLVETRQGVY